MNRVRWLLTDMFMGQNKLSITDKSEIKGTLQKSVMTSPQYSPYALVWNSEKLCRSGFSRENASVSDLLEFKSGSSVILSGIDKWKEIVKAEIKPLSWSNDESFQKVKEQFLEIILSTIIREYSFFSLLVA